MRSMLPVRLSVVGGVALLLMFASCATPPPREPPPLPAHIYSLSEVSKAPRPEKPAPVRYYPRIRPAMERRAELEFLVRVDGTASIFTVLRTNDDAFADECVATMRKWHFRPALLDGEPVDCWMRTTMVHSFNPP